MCLWHWSKGICLQETRVPQSHSSAFSVNSQPSLPSRVATQLRRYDIVFDKTGCLFVVLESSIKEVGGGYRASVWSFTRTQTIDLVSHNDLELQASCLGVNLLPAPTSRNPGANLKGQRAATFHNPASHTAHVFLSKAITFMTVEAQCIKVWEFYQGSFELLKRIHIKQAIK